MTLTPGYNMSTALKEKFKIQIPLRKMMVSKEGQ